MRINTLILAAAFGIAGCLPGGTSNIDGQVIISDAPGSPPTCATSTVAGELCVEGDVESNGALDIAGASTLTGAVSMGSTLAVTGVTTLTGAIVGDTIATHLESIRFCGNGPTGGTETYISPVPFDDTEADFIDGGSGCDGEDDTTIGTADEPWPILKDAAFKPVAMVCTALCTAAGAAASDTVIFRLMDDTAAVSGMTCTTPGLGGDANAVQCSVTDSTPATVAAGSLLAIGVDTTGAADECGDAGDDFSCLVYVTF